MSVRYGEEVKPLVEYSITGIKDVVEKYSQKPNIVFTFMMDLSGIPALKVVEANIEVEYTEKKRKKKAKKNEESKEED